MGKAFHDDDSDDVQTSINQSFIHSGKSASDRLDGRQKPTKNSTGTKQPSARLWAQGSLGHLPKTIYLILCNICAEFGVLLSTKSESHASHYPHTV